MTQPRRRVLVTGGATGIGGAITEAYLRRGWDVVCHYRSGQAPLPRLAEVPGQEVVPMQADFLERASLEAFLSSLDVMRIDALVNNAGGYIDQRHCRDLDLDVLSATFALNVSVPILVAMRVFEPMRRRGFGRIVNISSIAAKYGGSETSLPYGCAKRALEGLTRSLARQGASDNVLVNTLRPGLVETDFHSRFPKDMTRRVAMVPMRRMASPEEVARSAYFLGSEENTFTTNATLTVAGGE